MQEIQACKKGILFFDTSRAGDIVQYITALLRAPFLSPEARIVFAVSQWTIQKTLEKILSVPKNCCFVPLPEELIKQRKFKDAPGAFKCIQAAEKIAGKYECDQIYFLHLDTYMTGLFIRLFFSCKFSFSGLFYRPIEHYASMFGSDMSVQERTLSGLKAMIFKKFLFSSKIKSIQSFDAYFVEHSKHLFNSDKLTHIPDFASLPSSSVRPRKVPEAWLESKKRFLLFGHLSERKGILKVLEALKQLDSDKLAGCSFFFCGRVDETIQENIRALFSELTVSGKDKYVTLHDEFLDDGEIWWLINKCHLVLVPYQRHAGSSGVLSWAAAAGKPVLSESFGLVGHEVKKWGLGEAVNTSSSEAIASALSSFVQNGFESKNGESRQAEYAAIHTETNFSESLMNALSLNAGCK